MSKPFFLTRQTANLMEDFTRDLKSGSALYLLYGDTGVGKTRLLQELGKNRLSDRQIHWLDLASIEDDENLSDRSAEIESLFSTASSGDIIIADHFEQALKKPRHQLFLSWSTEGIDKQLNLVIASNQEGFNELRQLSKHYQIPVQSFQQMPYSQDEVEAFLGFYLFPDHPIGNLKIPAPMRKQLASTHGVVARIIELAEREGSSIDTSPLHETESIRRGSWTIVLVLSVIATGAGGLWYLSGSPGLDEMVSEETEQSQMEIIETVESAEETDVKEIVETAVQTAMPEPVVQQSVVPEPDTLLASELAAEPDTPVASDSEDSTATTAGSDNSVDNRVSTDTVDNSIATDAATEVNEDPPVAQEKDSESSGDAAVEADNNQLESATVSDDNGATALAMADSGTSSRFARELETTRDWLNNNNGSSGTIQIMSLGFDSFDESAYFDYLDSLKNRQVDIEEIRVFKTLLGNKQVYSLVYGRYNSRLKAAEAIDTLPAVLQKASPIPRSIGGIKEEIRRLNAGN